jgi:uncharacterized protein
MTGLVVGLAVLALSSPAQVLEAPPRPVVTAQGVIGARIHATIQNNLLVLDLEKDFLTPFRERNADGGYVGLGKLIEAFARFGAAFEDQALLAGKRELVAATLATQEADGYIGMLRPEARFWKLWDVHEMSYLIQGLATDHALFREEASLEGARKLADYIIRTWEASPDRVPGDHEITPYMAVTGIETAFLLLHEQTKDPKYLAFVRDFRKLPEWDGDIVPGRWGPIQGHVYAYICRALAQLRLDPPVLDNARRAQDFMLNQDGLVITGTSGFHECWDDSQTGTVNLGETCTVAYLIRFWDTLLKLEHKPVYGDLIERGIYNALFASQSPDGRRIRYYTPFEGPRAYFGADTYCCPSNYRRIVSELRGMVYHVNDAGLWLNLYEESDASVWFGNGEKHIKQTTNYPNSGTVRIEVGGFGGDPVPMHLRIPAWCDQATVRVGDGRPETARGGSYHSIVVPLGNTVELDMPMQPRWVRGRQAQAGRVALMYGPQVFCMNPGRNEELGEDDPRLLTIAPATLEGPLADEGVRLNGLAFTVKAWKTGTWYPHAPHDLELLLTEYSDPGGVATYFHVPNPAAAGLMDDPLGP